MLAVVFLLCGLLSSFRGEDVQTYTCGEFQRDFDKKYDQEEEVTKCDIFYDNLEEINEHNQMFEVGNTSYTMTVNKFADVASPDVEGGLLSFLGCDSSNSGGGSCDLMYFRDGDPPANFSWVDKGIVTLPKTQGTCGACWAFSIAGAVESQLALTTNRITSLSAQQLVDCVRSEGNKGCDGGSRALALANLSLSLGLMAEIDYPYEDKQGDCRFDSTKTVAKFETCYSVRPYMNEKALQRAVYEYGPVSAAVWATDNMLAYEGGIFEDHENCRSYTTNHAVLVVGYGTQQGKDYWLIKNSWGSDWGENGFMKLLRNKNNHCGIGIRAYVVTDIYYVASEQVEKSVRLVKEETRRQKTSKSRPSGSGLAARADNFITASMQIIAFIVCYCRYRII